MTKKKSKKKISKKQKSMKEGFTQAKEEQEKENPQKYDPAQKTGQDRVSDPVEPEIQRLAAKNSSHCKLHQRSGLPSPLQGSH